jgi:HlyD family secretion protein
VKHLLAQTFLLVMFMAGCTPRARAPDGSGTIECTQVVLAPQVGGRILQMPPQEGVALQQGDLVAQLDPRDYAWRRDEARASLDHATAQLDLVLAGSRDEDIQRARDMEREAQAVARAATADVQRVAQVFAAGSATGKQMDDARAAADRAAAALSAAGQAVAKLIHGSRQEEIRMAQALVAQGKARLALADKALDDCTVTAPVSGIVTARTHEEGEVVAAGTPLVTVSRLDDVWLSLYLAETRLARVRLGQPAYVRVDGSSACYTGVVAFISPEAEFTPRNVQSPEERAKLVYRIKVTLANPNGVFKPGMPADGFLERP